MTTLRTLRLRWSSSGGPSWAELGFARSHSESIATWPLHTLFAKLRGSPDCFLGHFDPDRAADIECEAQRLGYAIESECRGEYGPQWLEERLCAPAFEQGVRIFVFPSFSPEVMATLCDGSDGRWLLEVRVAREQLGVVCFEDWLRLGLTRRPGFDLHASTLTSGTDLSHRLGALDLQEPTRDLGLDGVTWTVHIKSGGGEQLISTWCPMHSDPGVVQLLELFDCACSQTPNSAVARSVAEAFTAAGVR